MERGYPPSKWDIPPGGSSSQGHADAKAVGRTVRGNMEEAIYNTHINTSSEYERKAKLSQAYGRSLLSAIQSSQVQPPLSSANPTSVIPSGQIPPPPDDESTRRSNPFPIEFRRKRDEQPEAPKPQVLAQSSVMPQTPFHNVASSTPISAVTSLNAEAIRQQIMLAGINALARNNPSLQAQLLLSQNSAASVDPFVNPHNLPTLGGSMNSSVPDGSGLLKYRAPDMESFVFDQKAGYRFDPTTGLHYDANSGLFINLVLRTFLRWDPLLNTYLRVDSAGISQPQLSGVGAVPQNSGSLTSQLPISPLPKMNIQSSLNVPANVLPAEAIKSRAANVLVGAQQLSNPANSVQDSFMNEIWQRMRALAKEAIGDSKMSINPSETVKHLTSRDISLTNAEVCRASPNSDRIGGKRQIKHKHASSSRSCSSSSSSQSSSSSSQDRRNGRKKRRTARSQSPSPSMKSKERSKGRKRPRSRSREARRTYSRSPGRDRRHSLSRRARKGRSTGRRSVSRGARRSHSGGRRSISRGARRSHSRGRRRNNSRSPGCSKRAGRSRSRGPKRGRTKARRSIDDGARRSRSRRRSRTGGARRSHSRGLRRSRSRGRRSLSRGARRRHSRGPRKSVSLSPGRFSPTDSPRLKGLRLEIHKNSVKREEAERDRPCPSVSPKRKLLSSTDDQKVGTTTGEGDHQADSDDLSEFDFLKETLDDDNESVVVDEYEETLEHDESIFESKSPESEKDQTVDIGDVLGHLFTNDGHASSNIVLVAPVPVRDNLKNSKDLKTQIGDPEDILKAQVFNKSMGSPCHYMLIFFRTAEAAALWYKANNGAVMLTGDDGSRMKGYLHFAETNNWNCVNCKCGNSLMSTLCRKCYAARDNGYSPVSVANEPTKWVGIAKLKSCYPTIESVVDSLPSLHRFNIKNMQMITQPRGLPLGLCVFEVPSEAEGTRLNAFFHEQGRASIYVIVNEKLNDSNVEPSTESTVEQTPDDADGKESSLTDTENTEEDPLAPLFASEMPKNILLVAPIPLSKTPKKAKADLSLIESYLQTCLESDGVKYDNIALHVDGNVGAPCSYGLIRFPDPETAADWRSKHDNPLSINGTGWQLPPLGDTEQSSKVFLHFSGDNWDCQNCLKSNFSLRSLCHHCFCHREQNVSGPIRKSMVTTRWVVTSKLTNWFAGNECIVADLKNLLKDLKLTKIDVLRDPKRPVFPLGCVFETESWGESLRLREFLHRTGRFSLFVTTAQNFHEFTCSGDKIPQTAVAKRRESVPAVNNPGTYRTPLSKIEKCAPLHLVTETCNLSNVDISEPIPDKCYRSYLLWWSRDLVKYSDILNHLFVQNPMTRVSCAETIFVGPLPTSLNYTDATAATFRNIIMDKLEQDKVPFRIISIHAGPLTGAPCTYGLVSFNTSHDAEAWHAKYKGGLILPNPQPFEKTPKPTVCPTSGGSKFFKTFVYYCKPNWRCRSCNKFNFGLRSNCYTCLSAKESRTAIIMFSIVPTTCVCIRRFKSWSVTEELLYAHYPLLKSYSKLFRFKILTEKSGIPLGTCILETNKVSDAQLLFTELRKNEGRKVVRYGIFLQRVRAEKVGNSDDTAEVVGNRSDTVEAVGNSGDTVEVVGNSGDAVEVVGNSGDAVEVVGNSGETVGVLGNSGETVGVLGNSGETVEDQLKNIFNDESPTKILFIGPVPALTKNAEAFYKALVSEEGADCDKVECCLAGSSGAPHDYCLVHFNSVDSATDWYSKCQGRVILNRRPSPDGKSEAIKPLEAFLHFSQDNWRCNCGGRNFPLRSVCFNCYKKRNAKSPPFIVSATPTNWLGVRLTQWYATHFMALSLTKKKYRSFKIVSVEFCSDPRIPKDSFGIYIIQVESRAAAKSLQAYYKTPRFARSTKFVELRDMKQGRFTSLGIQITSQVKADVPPAIGNTEVLVCPDYETIAWTSLREFLLNKPPTNVVMISHCPGGRELPSEAKAEIQNSLQEGGIDHNSIIYSFKEDVGSPFSYCLVSFDLLDSAKEWVNKCNGTFQFRVLCSDDRKTPVNFQNFYSRKSSSSGDITYLIKSKLHYSLPNWLCSCGAPNFPLRTLCHSCFKNKDKDSDYETVPDATSFVGVKLNEYRDLFNNPFKICIPLGCELRKLGHMILKIVICFDPAVPRDPCGVVIFEAESLEYGTKLYNFLADKTDQNSKGQNCKKLLKTLEISSGITYLKMPESLGLDRISLRKGLLKSENWNSFFVNDTPTSIIAVDMDNVEIAKFDIPLELYGGQLRKCRNCAGFIPTFWLFDFPSPQAAKGWYDANNGKLKSQVDSVFHSLHYTQDLWVCVSCAALNFPARVLCHGCYKRRKGESFPVKLFRSTKFTRFLGITRDCDQKQAIESLVKECRGENEDFQLKSLQIFFDPNVRQDGTCIFVFEVYSRGQGLQLMNFFRKAGVQQCSFFWFSEKGALRHNRSGDSKPDDSPADSAALHMKSKGVEYIADCKETKSQNTFMDCDPSQVSPAVACDTETEVESQNDEKKAVVKSVCHLELSCKRLRNELDPLSTASEHVDPPTDYGGEKGSSNDIECEIRKNISDPEPLHEVQTADLGVCGTANESWLDSRPQSFESTPMEPKASESKALQEGQSSSKGEVEVCTSPNESFLDSESQSLEHIPVDISEPKVLQEDHSFSKAELDRAVEVCTAPSNSCLDSESENLERFPMDISEPSVLQEDQTFSIAEMDPAVEVCTTPNETCLDSESQNLERIPMDISEPNVLQEDQTFSIAEMDPAVEVFPTPNESCLDSEFQNLKRTPMDMSEPNLLEEDHSFPQVDRAVEVCTAPNDSCLDSECQNLEHISVDISEPNVLQEDQAYSQADVDPAVEVCTTPNQTYLDSESQNLERIPMDTPEPKVLQKDLTFSKAEVDRAVEEFTTPNESCQEFESQNLETVAMDTSEPRALQEDEKYDTELEASVEIRSAPNKACVTESHNPKSVLVDALDVDVSLEDQSFTVEDPPNSPKSCDDQKTLQTIPKPSEELTSDNGNQSEPSRGGDGLNDPSSDDGLVESSSGPAWIPAHPASPFVIVAPLTTSPKGIPNKDLRVQIVKHLTDDNADFTELTLRKSLESGAPWHYCIVQFASPDSSKTWLEKRGRQIKLKQGPRVKKNTIHLFFGEGDWVCDCGIRNYFERTFCHGCFRLKTGAGFSSIMQSSIPSLWVAMRPSNCVKNVDMYVKKWTLSLRKAGLTFVTEPTFHSDPGIKVGDIYGVYIFKNSNLEESEKLFSWLNAKHRAMFVTPYVPSPSE